MKPSTSKLSVFAALQMRVASLLDRAVGWDRLPVPLGLFTLVGLRTQLRQENLHDTGKLPSKPVPPPTPSPGDLTIRTADGTFNDLSSPTMGSAGTRFGRNVPLSRVDVRNEQEIVASPSPRVVSRELLTREQFQPATTLNLLAAAWLQFQVHDWMSHGRNQSEHPFEIPLADDDPWPQHPMHIPRTRRDPTRPPGADGGPPTFVNVATHWWDASQIYGSDLETQKQLRSGVDGKLTVGPDGLLPLDPKKHVDQTGVNGNWWIGLSVMHTLFTLEHNAICDRLRAENPTWGDEELFQRARLINAALIAKIHTVQWTPGILGHPTLQVGMRGNWWGLAGQRLYELLGRISDSEVISGIPGSSTDHHTAPYAITEEFVAVYRMHPLIPDDFSFRAAADDRELRTCTFHEVAARQARTVLHHVPMRDVIYSFGTMNPGAITLHNYPRSLQEFVKPDGDRADVASIDILRDRERGVPRYNDFRELLHKPRVRSFEAMTDNPEWAEQLRHVYGDVDRVDTMVGLFAEPKPFGFGFSDTAFRIFILMASRRLKSDRFFTVDFTPEVYTQTGLDWIERNGFETVLLRHFPELRPALHGVANPFAPWRRTSQFPVGAR